MIRSCRPTDADRICEIYNHYVRETVVTFEELPVTSVGMAERIENVTATLPWLVWDENGSILGYAYAAPWRTRSAYRFSVESTVYLTPESTGRGIGTALYTALIAELKNRDVHCVVGGVALPNSASVSLHEKLGFQKIGQLKEIGWKLDRWVDVGYWELVL